MADETKMTAVSSSFIAAIGYDPDSDDATTGTVTIQFNDGAEFLYQGVSLEDYESLLRAPSIGKYFHGNFKRKYRGVRA